MGTPARSTASLRGFFGRNLVAAAVTLALLAGLPLDAQILKTGPEGAPQKLFINILEGEGALNNIRQRDAREPVVQVTDENHKPVAGAAVLFLIHNGGHGGSATFNGAQSFSTTTGPDGIARTVGLQVGKNPGSYTISVSASVTVAAAAAGVAATTLTATTVIHQATILTALGSTSSTATTVATHGILHLSHTVLIASAAVAAAATVVTVVAVTQSNNSTSLSLGSSTVTHP